MTTLGSEHLPMVNSRNLSWLLDLPHPLCLQIILLLLAQVATSWGNTLSITHLMEIPELCHLPLPRVQGVFTHRLPMPNLSEHNSEFVYLPTNPNLLVNT